MANSDYKQKGVGQFSTLFKLDADVGPLDTVLDYTDFTYDSPDPLQEGMALMCGGEIMRIDDVAILSVTVARGCADTTPVPHAAGDLVWLITNSIGTDASEHSAGEQVSVKVAPFTIGGGALPIEAVAPDTLTFNWRFFRPYAPAHVMLNGQRWFTPTPINEGSAILTYTWHHRDRVLQADQLLGHDDPSIGPEPGTTYTMRMYKADGTLVRTEVGIRGTTYSYYFAQAQHDMGNPVAAVDGYTTLHANRDDIDSLQGYKSTFTLTPKYPTGSTYQPFESRVVEAPYIVTLLETERHAMAMAARPSERMTDKQTLYGNAVASPAGEKPYTPWLTIDFRLPELEATVNIRSSSLYDGVRIDNTTVGTIALIDDELVVINAVGPSQFTIGRGVGDTVPAVHLPGARMWLLGTVAADVVDYPEAAAVNFKVNPTLYGIDEDFEDLPTYPLTFAERAQRPYPPGRIVVDGRPWFEEARALDGLPVLINWARRNRFEQGATPRDHTYPDIEPEVGQVTRVTVYYETPSTTPGAPATRHVLRSADVPGTGYAYLYSSAVADGNTAGLALGVCGTVLVYVQLQAVIGSLISTQSYTIAVRVPSYPCPA